MSDFLKNPCSEPHTITPVVVDAGRHFQEIDGFGVNINARYWKGNELLPVMDLLLDELGATLFRVDIWGKSNWIDPQNQGNNSLLNPQVYSAVYSGEIFQRGWKLIRFLNQRGIQPYLTTSGDVPAWMLGGDQKTLSDARSFCELLVSMVEWAKVEEKLNFNLLGPLNETDIGSPEGPSLSSCDFVKVIQELDELLRQKGLDDIRLVVAEQGHYNQEFVQAFIEQDSLVDRLGVFALHMYANTPPAEMAEVVNLVQNSSYTGARMWLTEYGDLEQSGEREWYVSWVSTHRLLNALEAGFQAGLAWDAFDNYHDHDEAWTIYGLIRTGLHTFTPKKRFYAAKQIYRYVRPGFQRLWTQVDAPGVRLLAFANPRRDQYALVGMNAGKETFLNIQLNGFQDSVLAGKSHYYRTSAAENCVLISEIPNCTHNWPFDGLCISLPGNCIFTLTNVS